MLDRIPYETCFASRSERSRAAAIGLGVVDSEWLGIFCIGALPRARRRGHGREIISALLRWGRMSGARRAYLAVHSTNLVAQGLYSSHGFEVACDYRYFTQR